MYSDLTRKKAKQNNSSQNCMVKINGKKMIMVTLNIKPSRLTTNRATHSPLRFSLQLDCINSAVQLFDAVEDSDLKTDEFPFKASYQKVAHYSTIASLSQIVNDLTNFPQIKQKPFVTAEAICI